tara:strand:+ start:264 stop:404 length:141 start_codon:yes stop_codon:yes gene_type:complete
LSDAKVRHDVVVLANGTVDVEADPQSYVIMQYKGENKEAVEKFNHY